MASMETVTAQHITKTFGNTQVLDEPFAGLDPVNTELLKDLVRELR